MEISKKVVRMGIDLSKHTFHVFGVDESGSTVVKLVISVVARAWEMSLSRSPISRL